MQKRPVIIIIFLEDLGKWDDQHRDPNNPVGFTEAGPALIRSAVRYQNFHSRVIDSENNVSPVKQIASVSELQFHYIPSYKHANEEQIGPLQCTAHPPHPSCLLVAVMEKNSSQYFFFPPDLATQFSGAQSPGRYCVFPAMASWTHLTVPCWMNASCRWIGRGSWPGFWRQTAAIKECSAWQQCR